MAVSNWTAETHLKLIGIQFHLTRDVVGALVTENQESESSGSTTPTTSGSLLGQKHTIEYKHRPLINAGAALTSGIFSLSFDTVVGKLQNEHTRGLYTPKRAYDIRSAVNWGSTFVELSTLSYRGFSVDNYLIDRVEQDVDKPAFPQLQMNQTALHGSYTFRGTKFSQRAPYDLAERQLRTAHAPYLRFSIEKFSLRNLTGESFVPEGLKSIMGNYGELSEITGWHESLAFGYAVTAVPLSRLPEFAPVFFHLNFSFGTGYSQSELLIGEKRYDKYLQGNTTGINMAIGFNGPAFFSAITYQTHFTDSDISDLEIEFANYSLAVATGARF